MERKKRNIKKFVYHALMILVCLLMLYPLIWMICSSFKESAEILRTQHDLIPQNPTFENYIQGWKGIGRNSFTTFLGNSLFVAILRVIGSTASAALTAYAFARIKFSGQKFWFGIMIATMCLPGMVLQIPQYLQYNSMGWVGTYLPLIVPFFLGGSPFYVFMLMQFMRNVNRSIDEAAIIDGCNWFQLFYHIMLPLIKPALATVAVMTFIGSWNDFYSSLIYLNKPERYPVAYALKLYADEAITDYGPMLAMSVLSLIPVIILFFIFQKGLVEGISTSGLKG